MDARQAKTRQCIKKATDPPLPAIWRTDSRPDPATMSANDRSREFGRILFRAIERKRGKSTSEYKFTPERSMEQQS